jgi:hypothetical protein
VGRGKSYVQCMIFRNIDFRREAETESTNTKVAFYSGGHADFIFRYAAKELFRCDDLSTIEWKPAATVTGGNSTNSNSKLQTTVVGNS